MAVQIAVYASWPAKHVTVNSVDIEERKAGRGRHKVISAMRLCACYAMSGADIPCAGTRKARPYGPTTAVTSL
eukprot:3176268-Rhodomonas_salina.2